MLFQNLKGHLHTVPGDLGAGPHTVKLVHAGPSGKTVDIDAIEAAVAIDVAAQAGAITVRYRLRLLTMIANRWLSFRKNTLSMGDRVLVVGDGEAGQIATWLLGRKMFRGAFSIAWRWNDSRFRWLTHRGMAATFLPSPPQHFQPFAPGPFPGPAGALAETLARRSSTMSGVSS